MRKRTIAALITAAVIAAACSSGSSVEESDAPAAAQGGNSAPAPKPTGAAKIGKTLTVKANGITADWTVTKAETRSTDEFGMEPQSGGKWVLIHAKVAVREGEAFVNPGDLSIISKSGKVYEMAIGSFKGKQLLGSANVAPGQNTDGWVFYDVAKADLEGARIQLKQQSLLDDTAFGYWTLATD